MDVVVCPHCQAEVDVSGFAPGTYLSCGVCGGEFEVPGGPTAGPPTAPPVPTPARTPGRGAAGSRTGGGGRRTPPGRRAVGGRSAGGPRGGGRRENVPDLLIWSILATLFCCLVGGIVAIVYSTQANSLKAQGNYPAAMRAANSAKTWLIVSVVTGIAGALFWLLSVAAAIGSG